MAQGLEILEARLTGNRQAEDLLLRLKKTTVNMTGVVASLLARGERLRLFQIEPEKILKGILENLCMKCEQARDDRNGQV